MTDTSNAELEGITLSVYLYTVQQHKPVGPRDVMKGVNLSSPSVAYRHLQKLEDLGYLRKNEFGEYTLKGKAHVKGFSWVGSRLIPKLWLYSTVFLAALVLELVVLGIHIEVETYEFKVFFFLLSLITGLAFAILAIEGLLQSRQKSTLTE